MTAKGKAAARNADPDAARRRRSPGGDFSSNSVATTAAGSMVGTFMDQGGAIDVDRVAEVFRMSRGQLAETVGLATASVSKSSRKVAPKTQSRMTEMLEIIARVRDWAGGEAQAMAWYCSQPLPALDGRTPEALVKAGKAAAVRAYLDHLALGGYA
jgi:uncharacterized protein (DUF2384 family)